MIHKWNILSKSCIFFSLSKGLQVETIKTSTSDISKKLVKSSSDVDSDFKTKKAPTSETPTPTTVIPSEREINCKPATPPIVASSTPAMGHGGSSSSGQDLNPRPSTSVVKIGKSILQFKISPPDGDHLKVS